MDWDTELTEAGKGTENEADWMVVLIGSGRGPPAARGARFVVKMFMAQFYWAEGEYARRFCRAGFNVKESDCSDSVFRSRFVGSPFWLPTPRVVLRLRVTEGGAMGKMKNMNERVAFSEGLGVQARLGSRRGVGGV